MNFKIPALSHTPDELQAGRRAAGGGQRASARDLDLLCDVKPVAAEICGRDDPEPQADSLDRVRPRTEEVLCHHRLTPILRPLRTETRLQYEPGRVYCPLGPPDLQD